MKMRMHGLCLLLGLTSSGIAASAPDVSVKQSVAPVCTRTDKRQDCRLADKRIETFEREVLGKAARNVETILLSRLKGAKWVPARDNWRTPEDGIEPESPQNRQACADRLAALREGRYSLFPAPDMKSTVVGVSKISERLEERRKQQALVCPEGIGKSRGGDIRSPLRIAWYYEREGGQAFLDAHPDIDAASFVHVENVRCSTQDHVLGGRLIGEPKKKLEEAKFSQYAFGLLQINDELFGLEGGVVGMADVEQWKYNLFEALRYDYYDFEHKPEPVAPSPGAEKMFEQATGRKPVSVESVVLGPYFKFTPAQQASYEKTGLWPGRILVLYPLNPINDSDICMWNLGG